jgi:uncharacterized protein
MDVNPVVWFEIYVQDMPRAQAFYEAVFGLKLETLDSPNPEIEMMAFPKQMGEPGATGALVKMAGVPSGGCGTLVYFPCRDCAEEAQKAIQHGGQIHRDKFSIGPYGHIALVNDTEGNLIGLYTPPEQHDC